MLSLAMARFAAAFHFIILAALIVPAVLAAPGPAPAESGTLSTEQVLDRMMKAQSGLLDFTAQVSLSVTVGSLSLPTIQGRLLCRRPDYLRFVVGRTLLAPRHPFLFPGPTQFTADRFTLARGGRERLGDEETVILEATSKRDGEERLVVKLWILEQTWLVTQSELTAPGLGHTVLHWRWAKTGDRAWAPVEVEGVGGLLLLDVLPLGEVLAGIDKWAPLRFRAIITGHQVNRGSPEGKLPAPPQPSSASGGRTSSASGIPA